MRKSGKKSVEVCNSNVAQALCRNFQATTAEVARVLSLTERKKTNAEDTLQVAKCMVAHILLLAKWECEDALNAESRWAVTFLRMSEMLSHQNFVEVFGIAEEGEELYECFLNSVSRIENGEAGIKIRGYTSTLGAWKSGWMTNKEFALSFSSVLAGIQQFSDRQIFSENVNSEAIGVFYETSLETEFLKTDGGPSSTKRSKNGSFYTPTYVVESMISQALDMLKDRKISSPKILDPAVGCGQFLRIALHALLSKQQGTPSDILSGNLFGYDIDAGAVTFCRLSLWAAAVQLGARDLPSLEKNIVCRNAILKDHGGTESRNLFDLVIGNPPYGKIVASHQAQILAQKYLGFTSNQDIFSCFLEAAPKLLNAKGIYSFIVPSMWLAGDQFENLRRRVLQYTAESLWILRGKVFKDASVDTCIFTGSRSLFDGSPKKVETREIDIGNGPKSIHNAHRTHAMQSNWLENPHMTIVWNNYAQKVMDRLKNNGFGSLGDFVEIKRGIRLNAGNLSPKSKGNQYLRYFEGKVQPYETQFLAPNWAEFSDALLERPRDAKWFKGSRILLRRIMGKGGQFVADLAHVDFLTSKSFYSILPKNNDLDLQVALAVINSKTFGKLYSMSHPQACKAAFPQVTISSLESMPFPPEPIFRQQTSRLKKLVLSVKNAKGQSRTNALNEIETLVCKMYGLNQNEIQGLSIAV